MGNFFGLWVAFLFFVDVSAVAGLRSGKGTHEDFEVLLEGSQTVKLTPAWIANFAKIAAPRETLEI